MLVAAQWPLQNAPRLPGCMWFGGLEPHRRYLRCVFLAFLIKIFKRKKWGNQRVWLVSVKRGMNTQTITAERCTLGPDCHSYQSILQCGRAVWWFSPLLVFPEVLTTELEQEYMSLQWCHNERDSVSIHRCLNCLHNRLFRWRRSRETSKLRSTGFCEGNSPMTGEFPTQGPVRRRCFNLMTSSCAGLSVPDVPPWVLSKLRVYRYVDYICLVSLYQAHIWSYIFWWYIRVTS